MTALCWACSWAKHYTDDFAYDQGTFGEDDDGRRQGGESRLVLWMTSMVTVGVNLITWAANSLEYDRLCPASSQTTTMTVQMFYVHVQIRSSFGDLQEPASNLLP